MKNVWPTGTLRLPLLGVLPACLVGVGIMRLHGAPHSIPLVNLAAALVGFVIVALISSALVAARATLRTGIAYALGR